MIGNCHQAGTAASGGSACVTSGSVRFTRRWRLLLASFLAQGCGSGWSPPSTATPAERLAYSIQEAADLLGIHYYTMYRLIQRQKIKTCRVLRGKLLVPRTELLKLLGTE